jgi:hypothetical protein
MRAENLTFVGLVVLPLAVAACSGLFVRSLIGPHGRTWWLWLLVAVVLGVVWYQLVSGAP